MIIYEHVNQGGLIMAEKKVIIKKDVIAWVSDECGRQVPVVAADINAADGKYSPTITQYRMPVSEYISKFGVRCYES